MNREQLAHLLRAAARIADDPDIVVLGSQAILGTFTEDDLPPTVMLSMEADFAFRNDPDESKSDAVDGAIGEDSMFHETHAVYAQGVSISTATLPEGWEDRAVPYDRADAEPSAARCVEAHDLVVSKLVAGREKDLVFATELLRAGLIDQATLHARTELLPTVGGVKQRVHSAIDRCARRAEV